MKFLPDATEVENKLGVLHATMYAVSMALIMFAAVVMFAVAFWVVFGYYGLFASPFIVVIYVLIRYHWGK